jgi:lysophospholipase L1-like esterase
MRRISLTVLATAFVLNLLGSARGAGPSGGNDSAELLLDTSAAVFSPGQVTKANAKVPAGTVERVEGKFGQALKFSFIEGASGGFMTAHVKPTPQWDAADGFSFWVKGDGSDTWGGIELVDRADFSLRYGYCFPIDSTEWRKIVVPWRDVIPELAGPLIGTKDGYLPSHFGNFWFGKWFYWRNYPANSFTIDHIAIEPKISAEPALSAGVVQPGLKRLVARLESHQPVTLVTMGDSLTDQHHWSNKEVVWHGLLVNAIKAKYGSDVKVVNPAIGGTTLSQNMILMPQWSKEAPQPDLVTVWFGGNDWGEKVRGPRFAEYLRCCVDRIREQTHGHADILLMTNVPGYDTWETRKELEEVTRAVAKEKQTGLADIGAAFRQVSNPDEALAHGYWARDKVHLGKKGHEVTSDTVMKAIESEK